MTDTTATPAATIDAYDDVIADVRADALLDFGDQLSMAADSIVAQTLEWTEHITDAAVRRGVILAALVDVFDTIAVEALDNAGLGDGE